MISEQLSRTRAAGLPSTLTKKEWIATLNYFKRRCAYCQRRHWEVIEHFVPVKQGGGTTRGNCVPACSSCNTCKDHPKFLLLGNNEKAVAALTRVAEYLSGLADADFSQDIVDTYIAAQHRKIPVHNTQMRIVAR